MLPCDGPLTPEKRVARLAAFTSSSGLTQALHGLRTVCAVNLPTPSTPASLRRHLLLPFLAYFLLLASTSFIAGGIVHLGLGENVAYYLALTVVGVVCFTIGNYLQEFVLRQNTRGTSLGAFLLVSFVLSIGIGMVTGGVQHFLDNPSYSAVLIPVGLVLAVGAFTWREGVRLGRKLPALLGGSLGVAALLFGGLSTAARALSPAGEQGHAHGRASPVETVTPTPGSLPEESAVPLPGTDQAKEPQDAAALSTTVQDEPHEGTTDGHPEGDH